MTVTPSVLRAVLSCGRNSSFYMDDVKKVYGYPVAVEEAIDWLIFRDAVQWIGGGRPNPLFQLDKSAFRRLLLEALDKLNMQGTSAGHTRRAVGTELAALQRVDFLLTKWENERTLQLATNFIKSQSGDIKDLRKIVRNHEVLQDASVYQSVATFRATNTLEFYKTIFDDAHWNASENQMKVVLEKLQADGTVASRLQKMEEVRQRIRELEMQDYKRRGHMRDLMALIREI